MSGQAITIYEADKHLGGGLFLGGSPQSGYNLPGSVFDSEFRCTFDLLATITSASDPAVSVKDEFFAFNERDPFNDRAHIFDRNGQVVPHRPRFGLRFRDFLDLAHIGLTNEAFLEGRRVPPLRPWAVHPVAAAQLDGCLDSFDGSADRLARSNPIAETRNFRNCAS